MTEIDEVWGDHVATSVAPMVGEEFVVLEWGVTMVYIMHPVNCIGLGQGQDDEPRPRQSN